jgi:hypothetical protein
MHGKWIPAPGTKAKYKKGNTSKSDIRKSEQSQQQATNSKHDPVAKTQVENDESETGVEEEKMICGRKQLQSFNFISLIEPDPLYRNRLTPIRRPVSRLILFTNAFFSPIPRKVGSTLPGPGPASSLAENLQAKYCRSCPYR